MTGAAVDALTGAACVGAAVVGGVFVGFSALVLPALDRGPAPQAVAAMQAVNVVAVGPVLMTALFGTAAASAALAVNGLRDWLGGPGGPEPLAAVLLGAAAVYLLGTVGVTVAVNVPLNDSLARVVAGSADASTWAGFRVPWSRANDVRAVAALVAAAGFAVASTLPD